MTTPQPLVKNVQGAEIVVLVLDLTRPVLGEQVFETAADGVAVATPPPFSRRNRW